VGLSISLFTYFTIDKGLDKTRYNLFKSDVELLIKGIQSKVDRQLNDLEMISFIPNIDRRTFNEITNVVSNETYILIETVYDYEREQFENEQTKIWGKFFPDNVAYIRKNRLDFKVPAKRKPFYFPITYINPIDDVTVGGLQNKFNILYDIDNNGNSFNSIFLSNKTRKTALTGPSLPSNRLINGVYFASKPLIDSSKRFVLTIIRIEGIIEYLTFTTSMTGIQIVIEDVTDVDNKILLGMIEFENDRFKVIKYEDIKNKKRIIEYELNILETVETKQKIKFTFYASDMFSPIIFTSLIINFVILILFTIVISIFYMVTIHIQIENVKNINLEVRKTYNKWIGYMCHSLRGPIHIIDYSIETLFDENGNMDIQKFEILKSNSERLGNLVNSYIDIGAIEANKLKLVKCSTDVCGIVNNIYHEYSIMCSKNVKLEKDISYEIMDVNLRIDPLRFRQIISCGVENANKYTKQGKITIKVERDDEFVVFSVIDTGSGITKSSINKLFSDYERGDINHTRIRGSGLGLVMSKMLAEKMKGRLTLESRKDGIQGCVFKFTIPYLPVPPSNSDEDEYVNTPEKITNIKDLVVHICEDERTHREILAEMLDKLGLHKHNILFFDDGERIIDYYTKNKVLFPNLIIMDIFMKRMNGDKAYKIIQEIGYNGMAVVVTGNSLNTIEYIDMGFDEIIMKPYNIDDIKRVLENTLKIRWTDLSLFEV
jgi:signal transduction histidine kinase/ActR/RegA family two-component response regulator